MISFIEKKRNTFIYRALCAFIAFSFAFTSVVRPSYAQLLPTTILNLPIPGTMVTVTPGFTPPMISGITIHPENPLEFDFIIGTGDNRLKGDAFEEESTKLIKYFLAALTVPEEEMWVNLSPYEKERMIPQGFGDTEMGRDLLAQDYMLKQLTASLMYPEDELGQKFWERVHKKAYEQFGVTEIPMNTFNKVWIVPDEAVVYEHEASAFVVRSHLKVMLEEDYRALQENMGAEKYGLDSVVTDEAEIISGVSTEVIREVLIPEIEKEVNEGETFANLRQIYNSVILATWYKQNLKESLLGQVYVDQNKTAGVDTNDKQVNQKIYDQYVEAFKKGVYNYIREDYNPQTQEIIPRKYFSGGATAVGVGNLIKRYKSGAALSLREQKDIQDFLDRVGYNEVNVKLFEKTGTKEGEEAVKTIKELIKQLREEKKAAQKSSLLIKMIENQTTIVKRLLGRGKFNNSRLRKLNKVAEEIGLQLKFAGSTAAEIVMGISTFFHGGDIDIVLSEEDGEKLKREIQDNGHQYGLNLRDIKFFLKNIDYNFGKYLKSETGEMVHRYKIDYPAGKYLSINKLVVWQEGEDLVVEDEYDALPLFSKGKVGLPSKFLTPDMKLGENEMEDILRKRARYLKHGLDLDEITEQIMKANLSAFFNEFVLKQPESAEKFIDYFFNHLNGKVGNKDAVRKTMDKFGLSKDSISQVDENNNEKAIKWFMEDVTLREFGFKQDFSLERIAEFRKVFNNDPRKLVALILKYPSETLAYGKIEELSISDKDISKYVGDIWTYDNKKEKMKVSTDKWLIVKMEGPGLFRIGPMWTGVGLKSIIPISLGKGQPYYAVIPPIKEAGDYWMTFNWFTHWEGANYYIQAESDIENLQTAMKVSDKSSSPIENIATRAVPGAQVLDSQAVHEEVRAALENIGSGITLPIDALPSYFGKKKDGQREYQRGDYARAVEALPYLQQMGQKKWAGLPLNPTNCDNCGYAGPSVFALDINKASPDWLRRDGWVTEGELDRFLPEFDNIGRIDLDPEKFDYKRHYFELAYQRFQDDKEAPGFENFIEEEAYWLDDYALFMAIKEDHPGQWIHLSDDLKHRTNLDKMKSDYNEGIKRHQFYQYLVQTHFDEFQTATKKAGITYVGDNPIYSNHDSAEVWAYQDAYLLDANGNQEYVSAVPPDPYSATGQRWGHALPDWREKSALDLALLKQRRMNRLYGGNHRQDHMIGLGDPGILPVEEEDARKTQRFPDVFKGANFYFGKPLFEAILEIDPDFGRKMIAEDLGTVTEPVQKLMDEMGFAGMKLFTFLPFNESMEAVLNHMYAPGHYGKNNVFYFTTHDAPALRRWWNGERVGEKDGLTDIGRANLNHFMRYMTWSNEDITSENVAERLRDFAMDMEINFVMHWIGDILIDPYSKIMGNLIRYNKPGITDSANWTWRLSPDAFNEETIESIRKITEDTNRTPEKAILRWDSVEKYSDEVQLALATLRKGDEESQAMAEKLIRMLRYNTVVRYAPLKKGILSTVYTHLDRNKYLLLSSHSDLEKGGYLSVQEKAVSLIRGLNEFDGDKVSPFVSRQNNDELLQSVKEKGEQVTVDRMIRWMREDNLINPQKEKNKEYNTETVLRKFFVGEKGGYKIIKEFFPLYDYDDWYTDAVRRRINGLRGEDSTNWDQKFFHAAWLAIRFNLDKDSWKLLWDNIGLISQNLPGKLKTIDGRALSEIEINAMAHDSGMLWDMFQGTRASGGEIDGIPAFVKEEVAMPMKNIEMRIEQYFDAVQLALAVLRDGDEKSQALADKLINLSEEGAVYNAVLEKGVPFKKYTYHLNKKNYLLVSSHPDLKTGEYLDIQMKAVSLIRGLNEFDVDKTSPFVSKKDNKELLELVKQKTRQVAVDRMVRWLKDDDLAGEEMAEVFRKFFVGERGFDSMLMNELYSKFFGDDWRNLDTSVKNRMDDLLNDADAIQRLFQASWLALRYNLDQESWRMLWGNLAGIQENLSGKLKTITGKVLSKTKIDALAHDAGKLWKRVQKTKESNEETEGISAFVKEISPVLTEGDASLELERFTNDRDANERLGALLTEMGIKDTSNLQIKRWEATVEQKEILEKAIKAGIALPAVAVETESDLYILAYKAINEWNDTKTMDVNSLGSNLEAIGLAWGKAHNAGIFLGNLPKRDPTNEWDADGHFAWQGKLHGPIIVVDGKAYFYDFSHAKPIEYDEEASQEVMDFRNVIFIEVMNQNDPKSASYVNDVFTKKYEEYSKRSLREEEKSSSPVEKKAETREELYDQVLIKMAFTKRLAYPIFKKVVERKYTRQKIKIENSVGTMKLRGKRALIEDVMMSPELDKLKKIGDISTSQQEKILKMFRLFKVETEEISILEQWEVFLKALESGKEKFRWVRGELIRKKYGFTKDFSSLYNILRKKIIEFEKIVLKDVPVPIIRNMIFELLADKDLIERPESVTHSQILGSLNHYLISGLLLRGEDKAKFQKHIKERLKNARFQIDRLDTKTIPSPLSIFPQDTELPYPDLEKIFYDAMFNDAENNASHRIIKFRGGYYLIIHFYQTKKSKEVTSAWLIDSKDPKIIDKEVLTKDFWSGDFLELLRQFKHEFARKEKSSEKTSSQIDRLNETNNLGGINLNPALLNLQIKRDGNGVPLPINMQPIGDMKIDGFVPVIINVTPVLNLPLLLGFADKDMPVNSADADSKTKPFELSFIDKYRNKYAREYEYEEFDV